MKAINQRTIIENGARWMFGYSIVLSVLAVLIIVRPVFAQIDQSADTLKPDVKIDVKKEYDENGNLSMYDSTYRWSWHGNSIPWIDVDSLFGGMGYGFPPEGMYNLFSPFQPFHPPMPDFFPFSDTSDWDWASPDYFHDFDSLYSYKRGTPPPPFPGYFWGMPQDSAGQGYHGWNDYFGPPDNFDFDKYMKKREDLFEKFREEQLEFHNRYNDYLREHEKLIEKYFRQPYHYNRIPDAEPENQDNKSPLPEGGKSGKI